MSSAPTLAPTFEIPEDLVEVGDWHPTRYTPSLSGTEEFTTEGDKLLRFAATHWRSEEFDRFVADPWQVWLIRHLLETYPPDWPVEHLRGQLRFRQAVVSLARQNGKSLLGALLAFYYLTMHVRGPRVVSVASVERQAKIVYNRVKYVVENNALIGREVRATGTRGITLRQRGGIYQTLPNDEESAQGEPVTGGVYDELHIGNAGLWDALVLGARSKRNAQLTGITTAGDADSDLLIRLYSDGAVAIDGGDERFGFFVWEAATDEVTRDNLVAANPAIACGRIDLETSYADAVKLWRAPKDKSGLTGKDRCLRYVLNRFVEGSVNSWASLSAWKAGAGEVTLEGARVFGLHRTEAWEWASITAAAKTADGRLVTELVASLEAPDHDTLLGACKALARAFPGSSFALSRDRLDDLGKALEEEGLEVWRLTAGERNAAAAGARAAIARRAVTHPDDALVNLHQARGRRRDLGDSWRISESLSTGEIDALLATVWGLHVAKVRAGLVPQLF